ncbi:MAG: hypothetical protein IKN82_03515 [Treponema sp.]|nr:hypothetical protein [Treponema sp.]
MAENVVKMGGSSEKKNLSGEQRLGEFLGKNRKALVCFLLVVVAAIVAYAIFFNVSTSIVKKNLDKIERIEYSLTKDAAALDESALASRRDTALSNLDPYLGKGGIVGARADMLAADIYGQKKEWEKSKEFWLKAASKGRGSYIVSLSDFNAAAACEELGQVDEALALYEKVSADKDFVNRSRAAFNVGRVKESKGDYEGAASAYEGIASYGYSNDEWNDMAKTRLLDLKNKGLVK